MKYGTFKYGEEKYGVFLNPGGGNISPTGLLNRLTLKIISTGNGLITITGNVKKTIKKAFACIVTTDGSVVKRIYRRTGSGIISILGNTVKRLSGSVGAGIILISGKVLKQMRCLTGKGSISIQGLLSNLKYYFIVTLDRILMPLGVHVLADSRQDLIPSIRENTETIPGRNGEIDFGNELAPRVLELHVATNDGLTAKEKEEQQIMFAHYLDPTKGNKVLIFEDDPDKQYNVKYSGKIDPNNYPSWLEFTIPFKMNSPAIPSTMIKRHSGSGTITSDGNTKTSIIIEITGSITNPVITLGSSSISYTGTIPSGQTLVIDTGKMTAVLNGANVLDKVTGNIAYRLPPGNTTITANNKVTILWYDKWD